MPQATEQLSPWAAIIEPVLYQPHATATEALVPRARAPLQEKPPQWEAHALQPESSPQQQHRPSTANK